MKITSSRYKRYKRLYQICVLLAALISLPFLYQDVGCAAGAKGKGKGKGKGAKTTTSTACDVDFLTQLQNNALLQAERQMIRGNVLMRKPDSVLEYTCYDQQAANIVQNIGPIFSGYSWTFQGYNVNITNQGLINFVNNATLSAIDSYIQANFSHDFLGGALSGTNNTISSTVAGAGNTCTAMYDAFFGAKCEDFAPDLPFTDFVGLTGQTPRALPTPCGSAHKVTQALIDQANNTSGTVVFDNVVTYLNYMWTSTGGGGGGGGNACSIQTPIPTGVKVVFDEHGIDPAGNPTNVSNYTYDDKVCPNPSCYFDHNNNSNGADDKCKP